MAALNLRARSFILRTLFLAEVAPGQEVASLALSQLADEFCSHRECDQSGPSGRGCRKHRQAVILGASKLIAAGELLAEMSSRGVMFVRLTPAGVLEPETWATGLPAWFGLRPDLVNWARTAEDRRRWEARV